MAGLTGLGIKSRFFGVWATALFLGALLSPVILGACDDVGAPPLSGDGAESRQDVAELGDTISLPDMAAEPPQVFPDILAPADVSPSGCDCGERVCGAPPGPECAGVSCGECDEGDGCLSGRCVEVDCEDRECGPSRNLPEISCGQCDASADMYCSDDGRCVQCALSCGERECGSPEGCPGLVCGECDPGWGCSPRGLCYLLPEVGELGASCQPHPACHGDIPALGLSRSDVYPDCLHSLCHDELCWYHYAALPFCSRSCFPEVDEVDNATGAPTPDGVEDPGSPSRQCEGFVDDVFKGPFRCVNLAPAGEPPLGFCLPGSDFRSCEADSDCTAGESCQLMMVHGRTSTYCMETPGGAVGVGELCNDEALLGEVTPCASGLCGSSGCSAFCRDDGDCATYDRGCDLETRTCRDDPQTQCRVDEDCSAWRCREGVALFHDLADEYSICVGRECFRNFDCRDSDFYCDPRESFLVAGDTADLPHCVGRLKGGAEIGEPCGPGADGAHCLSGICLEGFCSALCTGDSDCAVSRGQRCVLYRWDLVDSGHDASFGLCYSFAGAPERLGSCKSRSDCSTGTSCTLYPVGDHSLLMGESAFQISGVCRPDEPDELEYGHACGDEGSPPCRGDGFVSPCLQGEPEWPGYCSAPCRRSEDCPPAIFPDGSEYRGVCETMPHSFTGDSARGDIHLNYCTPARLGSSLEDCSETLRCESDPKREACMVNLITGAGTTRPVVEYLCHVAFEDNSLSSRGRPGDPCTQDSDCASAMCNPGVVEGEGYCGALCHGDADCKSSDLICEPQVWPTAGASEREVIVPNCRKVGACLLCNDDHDCAGGYLCTNLGREEQPKMVCARPCSADSGDCRDGLGCEAALDASGAERHELVCRPDCP